MFHSICHPDRSQEMAIQHEVGLTSFYTILDLKDFDEVHSEKVGIEPQIYIGSDTEGSRWIHPLLCNFQHGTDERFERTSQIGSIWNFSARNNGCFFFKNLG